MTAEGSIDKLSIEVSSTAASAVHDIKDLSGALAGLEGSIGGSAAKLTEVSRSVAALKNAAAGLQVGNLKQLNELKLGNSLSNNMKTLAAAVSLMPSDSHDRIAPLAALKALDGVKLSASVGGNLAKMATALTFMPTDTASRLAGLPTLRHLGGIKISSTVPNNLTKLAQAVNAFPADAGSRLAGLARALLPLKQLNGMKITSAINGLRELPAVLKRYETLNIKNLVAQLDQLNPRLKSLAVAANSLKLAFNRMPASLRTVASATNTVVSANRRLDTSMKTASRSTVSLIGKFGSLNMAFHVMWNGLAKCVNEVNTYIENMNLFEASMGGYTQAATEFGNKVQDLMGIDFGEWARNQGVFQTLLTGMGEVADRASVMSQQLTQLGYDISSFYNISVEDAMLKLQSGIAGELEPLRRLGWDLSNARMQLEVDDLGLDAKVAKMTQAEKVALRYYMIMTQVTQVHGDMARTIASPANQLRVLQAQVTLASRAIGSLLIPMLNKVLPYAIAAAKAIRILAQELANFLGIDATFEVDYSSVDYSGMDFGADALDDAADAADAATKKVKEYKNTVMGFDELNKLNDPDKYKDNGGDDNGIGLDLPLDTYDFLDGLDDYITKLSDGIAEQMAGALKKVLPIAVGIGTAIAGWKVGKALLDNAGKLSTLLGKGSDNAGKLSAKLKGMRFGNALGNGVRSLELGLMGAANWLGLIAKMPKQFLAAAAPIAAFAALVVARSVDLWMNSEKFRDGVTAIWGWLSKIPELIAGIPDVLADIARYADVAWQVMKNLASSFGIDLSFVDGLLGGLKAIADAVGSVLMPVVEALDLDFADLAITVGGIALLFVNPAWGAAVLAFEAITVAVRAIGWATEPCMESVDALADVSEETARRFGTSLDSMEGAIEEIDEISFSDAVVTEDDVASVGEKCEDIRDTILNNLDGKRNEELASIEAMAGFMTPEEIERAKARVNESYDQQKEAVSSGTAEINQILSTAKEQGVAISQEQSRRINEILDQQYQQLIETSGASSEEIAKIDAAMKNNREAAALEAAQNVIKEAQRVRDERKASAEEDCENQIRIANKMLEAGDIDKRRYDEIVAAAEDAKDMTLKHADEQYDGIVRKTESGLGEAASKLDFKTGEMKAKWQVFFADVGKNWNSFSKGFGEGWNSFWSGVGDKFEGFKRGASNAWQGLCNDIDSWYRSNLKPTIENVKDMFDRAGSAIGGFMSDPIGSIQRAWDRVSSWFQNNVINPIERAFSWMRIEIPRPKLPHITWSWKELKGAFGALSIPSFGIEWYAKGGFPTSGQLFMARENGIPEMVGSMGGKNAVANNQQIVEGIEQGVMSAMLQVLPSFQSSQGDGDVTLVLRIGNEDIAEASAKGQASLARRGKLRPEIQFV